MASAEPVDQRWKRMYRVGGISMLLDGPFFLILAVLAVALEPSLVSTDTALKNLAGQAILLQTDVAVSVLSDLLVIPSTFALYLALRGVNKNAMLVAAGFLGLFVILDLGLSVPNFPHLLALSQSYLAATSDPQRATYAASMGGVLSTLSLVLPICAFLVPSIGSFTASLVMLKGIFGRLVACIGIVASVAGIVVGFSVLLPALGYLNLINLPLFGIWFILAGFRLYKLGRQ